MSLKIIFSERDRARTVVWYSVDVFDTNLLHSFGGRTYCCGFWRRLLVVVVLGASSDAGGRGGATGMRRS